MEILHAIVYQNGALFIFRHASKVLFHHLDRVRELARGVGEIGPPNQPVIAHAVATANAHRIMQKAPVVVFPDVFAWFPFQTIETPMVMDHSDIAFVVIVDLPQAVLEPADHGLRPIKFEIWKTVPDTGKRYL